MSRVERVLVAHRLLELALVHDKAAEHDHYADTADTLTAAMIREPLLDADLLREAAAIIQHVPKRGPASDEPLGFGAM